MRVRRVRLDRARQVLVRQRVRERVAEARDEVERAAQPHRRMSPWTTRRPGWVARA